MDMKKRDFLGLAAGVGAAAGLAAATGAAQAQGRRPSPAGRPIDVSARGLANSNVQPSTVDWNYKPRRINKAIELWEDGQPIYYNGSGLGPGVDPYAQGVKMARTWYDAINVEMEHGAVDFAGLREFMRGLVDGGPTRSGHRTPAVFVETGIIGLDEPYARANTWVLSQLLDCGIHGIHQCHARDTKAVQTTMQMGCRYPFKRPGIKDLPMRGLRGSSAGFAAQVWGVDTFKYNHVADLWPLNPKGELIYGVKIEDTYADQQVEGTLSLPGLAMAEWGPGDHSYWLYGLDVMPEDGTRPPNIIGMPEMVAVRKKVLDLCKKNKVMFLNAGSTDPKALDYVIGQIDEGAMVLEAGEDSAIIGREHTKRKMPV
jgi:4-hydroxy-2-oxoheptanedioate aldolase